MEVEEAAAAATRRMHLRSARRPARLLRPRALAVLVVAHDSNAQPHLASADEHPSASWQQQQQQRRQRLEQSSSSSSGGGDDSDGNSGSGSSSDLRAGPLEPMLLCSSADGVGWAKPEDPPALRVHGSHRGTPSSSARCCRRPRRALEVRRARLERASVRVCAECWPARRRDCAPTGLCADCARRSTAPIAIDASLLRRLCVRGAAQSRLEPSSPGSPYSPCSML